jgi:hypothetical protein
MGTHTQGGKSMMKAGEMKMRSMTPTREMREKTKTVMEKGTRRSTSRRMSPAGAVGGGRWI